jgi:hypothetical protein
LKAPSLCSFSNKNVLAALALAVVQIIDNFLSLSVPTLRIIDLSQGPTFKKETVDNLQLIMFCGTSFRILFEFFVSLALLRFSFVIGLKTLISSKTANKLLNSGGATSNPSS